eukprot:4163823-Pleurochrysis_carterae.AAC.2
MCAARVYMRAARVYMCAARVYMCAARIRMRAPRARLHVSGESERRVLVELVQRRLSKRAAGGVRCEQAKKR